MKVKIVNKSNNPLPAFQTPGSAGMDICAAESTNIQPGEIVIISTGIYLELPQNYECQVRSRSGLAAKYGITVLNSPGTIDSDYRGEVKVILINHGQVSFEVNPGDRIAQLVFNKIEQPEFEEFKLVDSLESSERGNGGFGSTGL
jgi:dUTP pyrophosphatase